jgi:hypothetical protein
VRVLTVPGFVRHLQADLPLCGVAGWPRGGGATAAPGGRLVAQSIARRRRPGR